MYQEVSSREDFYNQVFFIFADKKIREKIDSIFYENKNQRIQYEILEHRLVKGLRLDNIHQIQGLKQLNKEKYERAGKLIVGLDRFVYRVDDLGYVYPRNPNQTCLF